MGAAMTFSYDPLIVAASLAMAVFVAFVALDLAQRVATRDRVMSRIWCTGGALVTGSGVWAVHFVGMMAHSLPVATGYSYGFTGLSWVVAVLAAAAMLFLAAARRLAGWRLIGGAALVAAGFIGMHQLGMMSLDMAPQVRWNLPLFGAAALLAWLTGTAALWLFRRRRDGRSGRAQQFGLATGLGLGMVGAHYMGMAAAMYAPGSVCLSADQLGGDGLVLMVAAATVLMQVLTLVTALLDARVRGRTRDLTHSLEQAHHQLQEANEELDRRAHLDPLTGLPNRAFFDERLNQARVGGMRKLAVLFVDLDGFKPVNDSLGHAGGDKVLREVADRLRRVLRTGDTVARIGGDEFVVLMEDVVHTADCTAVAARILDALARPFAVGDPPVHISSSVGITIHPDHGPKSALVAQADAAMRAAKRAGGRQHALFESHMSSNAHEQLSLQVELRRALECGELVLYYQPKIDSRRRELAGVEALVRWNHPERGLLGPAVFIPVAERFGLIGQLGQWVLDEACRQMKEWARAGLRVHVAINLSAQQLHEADLVERIDAALRRHGVAASQLLCEITETVTMEDVSTTQEVFGRLARIGVFIAIDDFGTGYSSLSYLRRLPARQLKIDRSVISDLETSADARAVVDAVVRLAHALGLRVVAEGVETAGQRDILVGMHCDELQGYLFARPMPADQLVTWSRRRPLLGRG